MTCNLKAYTFIPCIPKSNSSSIIVCHNHPSGNKEPSEADINLTRRIKEAFHFMDLILLDHLIIVPDEEFMSMAELGII